MSKPYVSLISISTRGRCDLCRTASALVEQIQVTFEGGGVEHARVCRPCRPIWISKLSRRDSASTARSGVVKAADRASSHRPDDESPSYRAALRDAGRGHLVR